MKKNAQNHHVNSATKMSLQRVLVICSALLLAQHQIAVAVPRQHGSGHERQRAALKTDGLHNDVLLTKIAEGDFVNIDLDRTDNRFGILFQQYLEAFAHHCSKVLPANKVEITRPRCATEQVTRNGYGAELSRVCVEYDSVGTGLFAKPDLYEAMQTVDRLRATDVGRELSRAFGDATRPDALSHVVGLLGDAQTIAGDMSSLVRRNGCNSSGLSRFEENLRLFALNKQPVSTNGSTFDSPLSSADGPKSKNQNYRKLIEDLVLDDTKRWGAFARFIDGSINSSAVKENDTLGRPIRVVAPYQWEGMLGRKTGQVTLTFSDGQPECLTYSETPAVCHSPNRRIAARYMEGGYSE